MTNTGPQCQLELNPRQRDAAQLALDDAYRYVLYRGGSRSGKSVLISYIVLHRAMRAPGSRHGVFRRTLSSCDKTLFSLTFPEVIKKCYPTIGQPGEPGYVKGLFEQCKVNGSDYTIELPLVPGFAQPSIIIFEGLEPSRLDKILGNEFATIWMNEVTDFTYHDVELLQTRLNTTARKLDGRPLAAKMFFDCNPKTYAAWEYKAFCQHVHPNENRPMPDPEEWVEAKLSPHDNRDNLDPRYLRTLENLSGKQRSRFLEGEWSADNDDAMFQGDWIRERRVAKAPALKRVVVGVDPAISNNKNSDETGIVVVGLGEDNHAYVLADYSLKGTPESWAKAAVSAYRDHKASRIVAEKNQGGLMVESTLRVAHRHLPITLVHASKNKQARAEPVSSLYERGIVHHVTGTEHAPVDLSTLEDQMTSFGMPGVTKSPDRLDALVWALTELMDLNCTEAAPGYMIQSQYGGLWGS